MGKKPEITSQEQLTPLYAHFRRAMCAKRPELDDILRRGAMRRTGFQALADAFPVVLLDAYGVLNRGGSVIPGAPAAVARLLDRGQHPLVVSNNASQSPSRVTGKLRKMGFPLRESQILTSGMAVKPFIAGSDYQNRPYYLVGTPDSIAAYAPDPEKWLVNGRPDAEWRRAAYILMCSNRDYYGTDQQRHVEALLAADDIPIILANPDLAAPDSDGGVYAVSGYTAMLLAQRFGRSIIGLGKPFNPIFELARQRFADIPPEKIMMVGDTLDTDILGAAALGFKTCLALSGVYADHPQPIENLCEARGICPDYVVESIAR